MNAERRKYYQTINRQRVLWEGIQKRDIDVINLALNRKASPMESNEEGDPPLVSVLKNASMKKDFNNGDITNIIFRTLLKSGADPNQTDSKGLSCLSYVLSFGKKPRFTKTPTSKELSNIIKNKADFEIWPKDEPKENLLSDNISDETIKGFWKFSKVLNALEEWSSSKQNKLNWDVPIAFWDHYQGKWVLDLITDSSFLAMSRIFLIFKSHPKLAKSAIENLKPNTMINFQHPITGNHLLIEAAHYERTDLIEKLIELGIDPKIKNKEGKSALDVAQQKNDKNLIIKLESYMLSYVLPKTNQVKNHSRL